MMCLKPPNFVMCGGGSTRWLSWRCCFLGADGLGLGFGEWGRRYVQRFRSGLVFKAHRLCVSLNIGLGVMHTREGGHQGLERRQFDHLGRQLLEEVVAEIERCQLEERPQAVRHLRRSRVVR